MTTIAREKNVPRGTVRRSLVDPRALMVRSIMSQDVVAAGPDDTITATARCMTQRRVSCVVVVAQEHRQVKGIFTERDIVRGLTECGAALGRMKVSERMSAPVETVPAHIPVLDAGRIMASKGIKRLPVVADQEPIGIVTQTDITRALTLLSPLRSVRDIMSRDVATVDAGATVAEATRIMAERGISCIVALEGSRAVGIVTEKDLARSVVAVQRNPADVRVHEVMSSPIVRIPAASCVHSASQKMTTMRLHRLVVMDDDKIRGIVTQSDIARAVRDDFEHTKAEHETVVAAIAGHVRNAVNELTRLQDLVRQSSGSMNARGRSDSTSEGSPLMLEVATRVEHAINELAQL